MRVVISLGGSLIVPDEIDKEFIYSFIDLIKEYVDKGFEFVIIIGGGKTCRKYNQVLKNPSNEELDWLGIAATRLNAELIKIAFGDLAYEKVLMDPDKLPDTNKHVIVGGGWKPGNSSDLAAIHTTQSFKASKVINLSNIDFVYNKDPRKFDDAEPITKTTWSEFMKIIPSEWKPGINVPFDPVAARKAQELNLEVVIMNGKNLNNLRSYLDSQEFEGTLIK
ncbi:MAG: UMP kinase [Patescibacteria group bacterium]|nr:UMP kinase [Patescibacteria group bacterium]